MSLFSEKQVLFLSAQDSTRNCHRKEIASCWCWSPGLGMQRFRASITFWTMSLLVKTNEIQYHLLRGYTKSSADGDSVGHTALALGHSFRLRLINWHVAVTLPVAEVNLCPLPILTGCKKKSQCHQAFFFQLLECDCWSTQRISLELLSVMQNHILGCHWLQLQRHHSAVLCYAAWIEQAWNFPL